MKSNAIKSAFLFSSLLMLSACGIVSIGIGENNYQYLYESQLHHIKPFDSARISSTVNNLEHLYLYEINTDDVRKVLSANHYTWIHLWPPWCTADMCENINYFQRASDQLKNKGVEFLLVSVSYDLSDVKEKLTHSEYNKPIFVLQDAYYGHKIDKARLNFYNEFKTSESPFVKYGFSDYLFMDTTLIYGGHSLTREQVDSLINRFSVR
ncbi:MAG: hypothetical protein ACM3ME_07915 [Chloroflexota bacterium]